VSAVASAVEPQDQVERLQAVVESLTVRNRQLEHALRSRIVIEQAKGVLSERYGIGVSDAFELLRRASRAHRLRIHLLAARVVESRETPSEVAAALVPPTRSHR
jgi:AmiR/NasT family two-component response regulator